MPQTYSFRVSLFLTTMARSFFFLTIFIVILIGLSDAIARAEEQHLPLENFAKELKRSLGSPQTQKRQETNCPPPTKINLGEEWSGLSHTTPEIVSNCPLLTFDLPNEFTQDLMFNASFLSTPVDAWAYRLITKEEWEEDNVEVDDFEAYPGSWQLPNCAIYSSTYYIKLNPTFSFNFDPIMFTITVTPVAPIPVPTLPQGTTEITGALPAGKL